MSEISILSQLSITLKCVNVKKGFAQPDLEIETFSKEKKINLAVIFLCSLLLTIIFVLPLLAELPLQWIHNCKCIGFVWTDSGNGRTSGLASVRACWKFLSRLADPVPRQTVRSWKDWCLKTFWGACVRRKGQMGLCSGELMPCSTVRGTPEVMLCSLPLEPLT